MTHGTEIPTLTDIEESKKAMDDIQSFTYLGVDSFIDAKGVTRDTVTGRIKKMGFAVPILYVGGIVFAANDNVKTVEENNIVYAPLPSSLPFTTSGTFIGDDDARFFVIQGVTEDSLAETANELKILARWEQAGFNAGGPVADSSNVIAGHSKNHIVSDAHSCTISGGGLTNKENVIGGLASSVGTETSNINPTPVLGTQSQFCVIGGGYDNVVNGLANVITAGQHCLIDVLADHGSIHGGSNNKILSGSYNTIGGGTRNTDNSTSGNNIIAGGADNIMQDGAVNSVIGGGGFNENSASHSVVSGGQANICQTDNGVIGGGSGNKLEGTNTNSVIGGGNGNLIDGSGQAITITGGIQNHATNNGAVCHGGRENDSQQQYSQTSGFQAKSERAGQIATAAGQFATKGDAQTSSIILKEQTIDETVTNLKDVSGGSSFPSTGKVAFGYKVRVVGHRTDVEGDDAVIILEGMATRGAAGTGVVTAFADKMVNTAGAASWLAEVFYSGSSLRIKVTGEAAKNINWVAVVEFTETVG